jgi:hypothetical protein
VRRRSTTKVSLGLSGVLACVLTGCEPSGGVIDADYAQVCQERRTEVRVEDDKCSDQARSSGSYGWYFYQTHQSTGIPAVGSKLSGGTTTIPAGKSAKSGVASKGGTVSRGGFGTSAKGGSNGG